MPKLTSDLGASDPTVAGQAVPLLARDESGNEIDWRQKYACACPPGEALTEDQLCPGCKGLTDLLARLRADRRTRQATSARGSSATRAPRERQGRRVV